MTTLTWTKERPAVTRTPGSYEEYLAWPGEETHIVEWKNGEIIEYIPPLDHHQDVTGFLYSLLAAFVRLLDIGVVRVAPLEVKLWPNGPSREPDVFFVAKERLSQLTDRRFLGGPDLAIEIVSTSSTRADRVEKFIEYEQAGVREYWIIDPRRGKEQADFYQLEPSGRFVSVPLDDAGRYHSAVLPGFHFDPAALRVDPLPPPQFLLAELAKDLPALPDDLRAAYHALYVALKQ